jgi:hypothetical protein
VPFASALGSSVAGLVSAGAVLAETTGWSVEPNPNPSPPIPAFDGVAATSTKNAWAVGHWSTRDGPDRTLSLPLYQSASDGLAR